MDRYDEDVECPECGTLLTKLVSRPNLKIWKPITLDHIADQPMTFNKEKDLRDYCNTNGLASGALL